MSNWGALWALDAPVKTSGSQNPQGTLAAPVGTIAVRACDGSVYVKRGGGSTAFGWYLLASDQFINWQPRFVAGGLVMVPNASGQTLTPNPSTIINFLPQQSAPGVGSANAKRQYAGGYTSAVAGNTFLFRPTNNVDNMPSQRLDDSLVNNFQEFDFWWDVFTTPRSTSAATSTDLTTGTMRIWAGGAFGSVNVQLSGGTVDSNTLATEWPTALSGADGLFGFAFRFSSATDAGLWQFVSTVRVAGVYGQTVTPMSAIAANTSYRLRVRYVFVSGVLTALASINDGTEVAITTNVAPVAPFTAAQTQPFQPLCSVRNISGTTKSLVAAQCAMNYGIGVGLTC